MVNQEGKRFVDTTNNDKTGVTMAMLKASKGTGIAYLIFDQEPVSRLAILQDYVAAAAPDFGICADYFSHRRFTAVRCAADFDKWNRRSDAFLHDADYVLE